MTLFIIVSVKGYAVCLVMSNSSLTGWPFTESDLIYRETAAFAISGFTYTIWPTVDNIRLMIDMRLSTGTGLSGSSISIQET
jgi:hypothetical protein